jgi:hypothetical protein
MVGTVTNQSSSTVASGEVISENPAAGTSAAAGTNVALVVSSGPASVSVPNVVGDTQAAASTAITGAGLTVGTVTMQASATVAAGKVISENPTAATSVAKGSAVALVVSSGPGNFTVGGTLIGLGAGATVQVLNGTDTLTVSANGSFTLPTGLLSGGAYVVTVGVPTTTRPQTCNVQNGSGTVTGANVTDVVVYCTYTATVATLDGTYTTVDVDFDSGTQTTNPPTLFDCLVVATYSGSISSPTYIGNGVFDVDNGDIEDISISNPYAVTTTDGIVNVTNNEGLSGGIEGANADAVNGVNVLNGLQPGISLGVLPNAAATTASIDGEYTLVNITGVYSTETMSVYDAIITVANGAVTGTYVENDAGTITTGNAFTGTWSVTNGAISATAFGSGAVSSDGDLIVLADTDTTTRDNPAIEVAVRRGSGVTNATFEGVYSVSEYGGAALTALVAKAMTLFAYGNGTYSVTYTENASGTVTTNNTDTGTYTIASDGTLTLTGSKLDVYTGALAADGNALALASVTPSQNPAILAGIRQ